VQERVKLVLQYAVKLHEHVGEGEASWLFNFLPLFYLSSTASPSPLFLSFSFTTSHPLLSPFSFLLIPHPRRSDRNESIGIAFAPSKIIFRKVVPLGNVNTLKVGLPTSKEIWEPTRTRLIFRSAPLLFYPLTGFIFLSERRIARASLTTLNSDGGERTRYES